jgi:hypothetical protein
VTPSRSRRLMLSVAALTALVLGWAQPIPSAGAGFNSAPTASAGVAAHALVTPVLTCDAGGLLFTTVTLRWTSVSSATTTDLYSTSPSTTYLADGYQIERSTNGASFVVIGTAARTATSYPDSPGGVVTTYRYQVRSKNPSWVSPPSNLATASVTGIPLVSLNTSCTF